MPASSAARSLGQAAPHSASALSTRPSSDGCPRRERAVRGPTRDSQSPFAAAARSAGRPDGSPIRASASQYRSLASGSVSLAKRSESGFTASVALSRPKDSAANTCTRRATDSSGSA